MLGLDPAKLDQDLCAEPQRRHRVQGLMRGFHHVRLPVHLVVADEGPDEELFGVPVDEDEPGLFEFLEHLDEVLEVESEQASQAPGSERQDAGVFDVGLAQDRLVAALAGERQRQEVPVAPQPGAEPRFGTRHYCLLFGSKSLKKSPSRCGPLRGRGAR